MRAQELGATPFDAGNKAQPLNYHDGECTFEAILECYGLNTPVLQLMAAVVYSADIANASEKQAISDGCCP